MNTFVKQAAIHCRLNKMACIARLIRRQRFLEKSAQMQKIALSQGAAASIGAGIGGLVGGGIGYGLGGKNNKLFSTLAGAGIGAGVGGIGGYYGFGNRANPSLPTKPGIPPQQYNDELAKARELAMRFGMPAGRASNASMLDLLSEISIAANNAETAPVLTSDEMTQVTDRLNLDEDAPIVEKIKAQNNFSGRGPAVFFPKSE